LARNIRSSDVPSGLTALIGADLIFVGARFLWNPREGAEGYGVPERPCAEDGAYLAAKGLRDIATGPPRLRCWRMRICSKTMDADLTQDQPLTP
jgi:hypothetical protein